MPFTLYFGTNAAPEGITREQLDRIVPVHFSTEKDALHGAALVVRGGQHPWLIEGPGIQMDAQEIARKCEPILQLFHIAAKRS